MGNLQIMFLAQKKANNCTLNSKMQLNNFVFYVGGAISFSKTGVQDMKSDI